MIARAQAPITLRFQSTWPQKFIYHECAVDWCKKASDLTGGRLKIEMLPAGAVVPGLQVVDAVSKGVLDGGHGIPAFWFGKNIAFGLYGAGPDFGMDANQLMGWVEYGGGKELFVEIQQAAQLEHRELPRRAGSVRADGLVQEGDQGTCGPERPQVPHFGPCGGHVHRAGHVRRCRWRPRTSCRRSIAGVLDGAEFASATDDRVMGFPDVAKFYLQQSYHMANNFCEVMFNKTKHDALAGGDQGDPEIRSARGALGHAVEVDAPHVAGLHRGADEGQGQGLPHAQSDSRTRSSKPGIR